MTLFIHTYIYMCSSKEDTNTPVMKLEWDSLCTLYTCSTSKKKYIPFLAV